MTGFIIRKKIEISEYMKASYWNLTIPTKYKLKLGKVGISLII
jgi:hypothetical protein